ncbi:MAG TPA: tRNA pseudouridine(13) synthase TruD [Steroidobacteraceae bacterium]|nr:tRNA pseudouridine(13) synthase TruD [Steroidobacteraceae bacterium]
MIPDSWRRAALAPPFAHGGPLASGVLRSVPQDFVVDEILGFEAGGDGPHALLHVRKLGANTEWVARELARAAGCKPFDVGFAGMKDRNAVTTQYFTVPRGKRTAAEFLGLAGEGYEVIAAAAHQRKLPRGALAGNRFEIVARGVTCDPAALAERIAGIATGGVPNYFGEQRFGRDAGNLADVMRTAERLASSAGVRPRSRGRGDAGFMLSAARSLVFNAILGERVADGSWNRLRAGDVANLDGRGSVFAVDAVDGDLAARVAALDVHPTAPLVGEGESLATGDVRALEESVAARFPEALAVIASERMNAERRAMRLRVGALHSEYSGDVLRLRFELAAGSFATTVLREIIAAGDGES